MGFLSSIVGGLATAAFGPVGGAIAGAVVGAGEQRYAEKKQNEAIDRANDMAIERESTQFVRMRDAAQRAGFNPLTVLRSGMFQQAGLLSRQAETWKGSLFGGVANAVINAPELRLDREMRELEKQERMANIEYTGALARNVGQQGTSFNPLDAAMSGYLSNMNGYTVMRSTDGSAIEVRNDILHALRLPPGSLFGIAEHYEAIGGEIQGEAAGVGVAIDDASYPIVRQINGGPALPNVNTGQSAPTGWGFRPADVLERWFPSTVQ